LTNADLEIALDRPFWEYRSAAEGNEIAQREQQVYLFAERTPELRRVMPRCFGAVTDAVRGEHALFMEFIADAARLDASGALADWPPDAIDAALTGAAGWQAVFGMFNRSKFRGRAEAHDRGNGR
jgi:hypothetical protein